MPALPSVPNVASVITHYTIGVDTTTSNRLFMKYGGGAPTNADCLALCSTFEAAFQAGPILSMGAWTALTRVEVHDLSKPDGGYAQKAVNHPGTAGGGVLPGSAAAVAIYTIARRYRGGKPKSYVPMGTDTDMQDAQHWTAAAVTNFTNHWLTYLAAFSSATWSGGGAGTGTVNVSYYSGAEWVQNPISGAWKRHAKPRPAPLVDQITGAKINSLLGSQRRRITGRFN